MAHKKTRKRKRSHHKGLSSPAPRKRHRKRSSFLGDLLNPTMAMNSAKSTLTSALGGYGAIVVNKTILPTTWGKPGRVISGLVAGFLLTNFGMPTLGASLTGGMTALTFKDGLLNDDANFAEQEALNDQPKFLDEAGNPLFLDEKTGEFYYPVNEGEYSSVAPQYN